MGSLHHPHTDGPLALAVLTRSIRAAAGNPAARAEDSPPGWPSREGSVENAQVSGSFQAGTGPALPVTVVIPLRARVSAIAIVAAMLVAGAAPLLANGSAHRACLAHQHDCTKAALLSGCCGLDQSNRSDEATPATGKAQIAPPVVGTMAVTSAPLAVPELLGQARALTTSPRSSPPDLITLFGAFLI
jgi:hypothetical protein